MKKSINIAVVGLGQVGSYLLNELNSKKKDIELKTGKKINVVAISARNINKKRQFKIDKKIFFKDPLDIFKKTKIDVFFEAIGQSDGVSKKIGVQEQCRSQPDSTTDQINCCPQGRSARFPKQIPWRLETVRVKPEQCRPAAKVLAAALLRQCLSRPRSILQGPQQTVDRHIPADQWGSGPWPTSGAALAEVVGCWRLPWVANSRKTPAFFAARYCTAQSPAADWYQYPACLAAALWLEYPGSGD